MHLVYLRSSFVSQSQASFIRPIFFAFVEVTLNLYSLFTRSKVLKLPEHGFCTWRVLTNLFDFVFRLTPNLFFRLDCFLSFFLIICWFLVPVQFFYWHFSIAGCHTLKNIYLVPSPVRIYAPLFLASQRHVWWTHLVLLTIFARTNSVISIHTMCDASRYHR